MFIIAMHNRTGSSWLCSMLNSVGLNCHEFLLRQNWKDTIPQDILKWDSKTGIKNELSRFKEAIEIVGETPFIGLKCIWVRRKNILASAISNYRATYTNSWNSQEYSDFLNKREVPFNYEEIKQYYDEYLYVDSIGWPDMFSTLKISPLEIFYEDLCEFPIINTSKCLDFLGFKGLRKINTSLFQKDPYSDEVFKEWESLFSTRSQYE